MNRLYSSPTRLFLIINGDEYQIREPQNWKDAEFAITRKNHGFEYRFPNTDLNLEFHDRKTAGTDYDKAKELIDQAFDLYGTDVEIFLRLEYFNSGTWNALDQIELTGYKRNEYDSLLKTFSGALEKKINDLLETKVNLYADEDVNGNSITQMVPTDVWYHSKVLRKNLDVRNTSIYNQSIDYSDNVQLFITLSFPTQNLNEISDYNTSYAGYSESSPVELGISVLDLKEAGSCEIRLTNLTIVFFDTLPSAFTYTSVMTVRIVGLNSNDDEIFNEVVATRTITTTGVGVIASVAVSSYTFTYDANIGDRIFLYVELNVNFSGGTITSNGGLEVQFGNFFVIQDTEIPGGFEESYPILPTLQKVTEILTGSVAVESDFLTNTVGYLYLTSGSILKGLDLSDTTAPSITLKDALESLDAILNMGWSFEDSEDAYTITIEPLIVNQNVTGSVAGAGKVISLTGTLNSTFCKIRPTALFTSENITGSSSGTFKVQNISNVLVDYSGSLSVGNTVTGSITGATGLVTGKTLISGLYYYNIASASKAFRQYEYVSNGSISVLCLDFFSEIRFHKFAAADTITGDTSGATATVNSVTSENPQAGYAISISNTSGTFQTTETISSGSKLAEILAITEVSDYIRFEESEHFYNTESQMIDLSTREIWDYSEEPADDYIFNEAKFGYPDFRYDELNTVDEFNTQADYLLASRKLKKVYEKKSKYKTQGYDIEFLRRQALKTDSTAFKEDKDIYLVVADQFVKTVNALFNAVGYIRIDTGSGYSREDILSMVKKGLSFTVTNSASNNKTFTVASLDYVNLRIYVNETVTAESSNQVTITNTYITTESNEGFSEINNVISPETVYNARLSPARNKMRHDVWLNASQHFKELNSEVVNTFYDYNGEMQSKLTTADPYYDPNRTLLQQNQNFRLTTSNGFKHWVIPVISRFSAKLTFTEFLAIKTACRSAYGYTTHKNWNGDTVDTWLLSLKGKPTNNEFEFVTLWWRINGESPIPPADYWQDHTFANILTGTNEPIEWT